MACSICPEKGVEMGANGEENLTISATAVRENRQVTLPRDVFEAAGLRIGDQLDWQVEGGEIRAKKIVSETVEVLDLDDLDPKTLAPKRGRITRESILKAVRAGRDGQR